MAFFAKAEGETGGGLEIFPCAVGQLPTVVCRKVGIVGISFAERRRDMCADVG